MTELFRTYQGMHIEGGQHVFHGVFFFPIHWDSESKTVNTKFKQNQPKQKHSNQDACNWGTTVVHDYWKCIYTPDFCMPTPILMFVSSPQGPKGTCLRFMELFLCVASSSLVQCPTNPATSRPPNMTSLHGWERLHCSSWGYPPHD